MPRLTRFTAMVAIGAITLGIAACGEKEEPKPVATPTAAAKAASATAVAQVAPKPLTVTGMEYAFSVDGQAIPGVQTITFRNAGKEDHELQLVSLDQGKTIVDAQKILVTPNAPIPDWVKFNGGAWSIPAGAQSTMTADLNTGAYTLLCFLEAPDKLPHFAKGMVGAIEVKGEKSKEATPTGTLAIEASDYAFKLPAEVTAGKATIALKNTGKRGALRWPDPRAGPADVRGVHEDPPHTPARGQRHASCRRVTTTLSDRELDRGRRAGVARGCLGRRGCALAERAGVEYDRPASRDVCRDLLRAGCEGRTPCRAWNGQQTDSEVGGLSAT